MQTVSHLMSVMAISSVVNVSRQFLSISHLTHSPNINVFSVIKLINDFTRLCFYKFVFTIPPNIFYYSTYYLHQCTYGTVIYIEDILYYLIERTKLFYSQTKGEYKDITLQLFF